jgi:hypothetical protein
MSDIFPETFFAPLRAAEGPKKRLMAAVLEDAVHVYAGRAEARTRHQRELVRDVDAWFETDDAGAPFAFRRVADELGFDPGWFRRVLARWRAYDQTLHGTAPVVALERLAS